jgi:small-conductance mechanosensitive channel
MSHPWRAVACLVALGFCLGATPEATPETPEPPLVPAVVSMGEIAARAEAAERRIAEVQAGLPGPRLEAEIEALLAAVVADLVVLEGRIESKLVRRPLATELETLATRWHSLDERLASRSQRLGARASLLDAQLQETREASELWDRTRKAARGSSAPRATLLRVERVRKSLTSTAGLIEQARNDVLRLDSPPEALFIGFGDSSLDFELRAFTSNAQRWKQVRSDLALTTSEALKAAGIRVPFPQRDLHLKNVAELGAALRDRRDPEK